jgi:hypothetical protein
MNIRAFLPSARFTLLAGSLVLAGAAVAAAEYFTAPQNMATLTTDASQPAQDPSWAAALYQIEAQNASSSFEAANPDATDALLKAAQTGNLTNSVSRSILIGLASAKSQGLGDDVPTQDALVNAAANQIAQNQASTTAYAAADLIVVPVSTQALHTYGNAVMQALSSQPAASERATFISIDAAVEGGDKTQGANLAQIGAAYRALAAKLLEVPVPQPLAPLHLQAVNNLVSISATYADMATVSTDPVRALAGLQTYESFMDAGARVFTEIAQTLNKDGIIFTKDEPGSAWSVFVSPT